MAALVTFAVLEAISLGVAVWAIVDAASRPTDAFVAARSSKALWITLVACLTFFLGFVGLFPAIWYFNVIRPRVRAAGG